MLKAGDLMTKNVVSVKKDTPIYEALELLRKNDITGMPVIEDDKTLVGIITEKDVLKLFYAEGEYQDKTVDYCMTQPAVSFGIDVCMEGCFSSMIRPVLSSIFSMKTGSTRLPPLAKTA